MFYKALFLCAALGLAALTPAQTPATGEAYRAGDFKLVYQGAAADLCVASEDYKVAHIAAGDLAADIERVTGLKPRVKENADGLSPHDTLPTLDAFTRQEHFIDIFKIGATPFNWTAAVDAAWVHLSQSSGRVNEDVRLWADGKRTCCGPRPAARRMAPSGSRESTR